MSLTDVRPHADTTSTNAPSTDAWIRRFGPETDGPLVVCFPHAGGSASFYKPFSDLLAGEVEVWAMQYPARQDRLHEEPVRSMHELSRLCAAAILAAAGERRPMLFGHSMGSLVAFEVASLLERAGAPCRHLVASGRGAPSIPFTGNVSMGDDAAVVEELRRMEGTDPLALQDPELLELALPAIRADYALLEGYSAAADAQVSCPTTVLCGDRDPLAPPHEVARWAQHSTGTVETRWYPGGHFYLVEHAREVADVVGSHAGRA